MCVSKLDLPHIICAAADFTAVLSLTCGSLADFYVPRETPCSSQLMLDSTQARSSHLGPS
jgi:hypothetical protein